MPSAPQWDLLVGCNEQDMIAVSENTPVQIHRHVLPHFQALQQEAKKAGFDIAVISGYRSFERQLAIWNAKAKGLRPLLSSTGQVLAFESLSKPDLLEVIMRWSALPSASRHHWGTDIDIVDTRAMPDGYQVQLTTQECVGDGLFAPMHDWLDEKIANGEAYGFFRPYDCDRGGVAPERWHLSYAPLSFGFEQAFCVNKLKHWLTSWPQDNSDNEFLLLDIVLAQFDVLFERFMTVPHAAYSPALDTTGR